MKYLLSFNESYKKDKLEAIKFTRKKYENIVKDNLLYLSDNYYMSKCMWDHNDFLVIEFDIPENDNRKDLSELVKSSMDKLDFNGYSYLDDYIIYISIIEGSSSRYSVQTEIKSIFKIIENIDIKIKLIQFIIRNPK